MLRRPLFLVLALAACDRPFDAASQLESLRVLAIRADHPTPTPGGKVQLDALVVDASKNAPRKWTFTWVAGCWDPPGDLYYQCYSQLEPALAALRAGTPSPLVGQGTHFTLDVPADLITRRKARSLPYGLSYVFYVACTGRVVVVEPNGSSQPPLGCVDERGEPVLADGFVFGYLPLYSYPTIDNQNPTIASFTIAGKSSSLRACIRDTDCSDGEACSGDRVCRIHLPPCTGRRSECASADLVVSVPAESSEPDPISTLRAGRPRNENVYVQYYTTKGTVGADTILLYEAETGKRDADPGRLTPSSDAGDARVFAVVHDGRGGVTWAEEDVVIK